MHKFIQDAETAKQIIQNLKDTGAKGIATQLGYSANITFYQNPDEEEGGYILVTAVTSVTGTKHYQVDITDDIETMLTISKRSSYAEVTLKPRDIEFVIQSLKSQPSVQV